MDLGLKGRVALVTGSSRGLGKAIAKTLASEGVNVVINGRNSRAVGDLAYEIETKFQVRAYQLACDATNPERIKKLFIEKASSIGRLDILVNNTGNIEKTGNMFELDEADWFRAYDLSFMSMIRFSLATYPWLKKSGHGRIINIGSLAAIQPNFNATYPHYAAAKAAMTAVSKIMANDFAKDNILVNTICPSTLHGGGWHQNVQRRAERDDISEQKAEFLMVDEGSKKSPLGRLGKLEDVANLTAFLASDRADYITGQVFCVDGGIKRSII